MSTVHPTVEAESAIAERYQDGYRIARGFLPQWGLLNENDSEYDRPLSRQVAVEIGPDEAVEYAEVWELIVAVAQTAYEEGRAS